MGFSRMPSEFLTSTRTHTFHLTRSQTPSPTPRPIHRRTRSVCSMTIRIRRAMANLIWTSSWPLYRLPVTKTLQKKEDEICHKIYIVWRTSILGPEFTFNNPILLYSPSTLLYVLATPNLLLKKSEQTPL